MIPIASPSFGKEEEEAVLRVLRSGHVASGPEVAAFEEEFAAAMDAKHAVAVTNGTVAIQAALEALGVGPGDEVLVPAFTFIATANAVLYTGAEPVFVDIDPATFCMDPEAAAAAVTERTKALLPVHLYGHPADMGALADLGEERGLPVLGDAAQAHGARWDQKGLGGLGHAATWSLYPTKNLTSGEGGMVTTDDEHLAGIVRSIANHGRARAEHGTYEHIRRGTNHRMTDLHAAIGRVQLGRLDGWLEKRSRNAQAFLDALEGHDALTAPSVQAGCRHAWHQFTLRSSDREALRKHLADAGIGSAIYYPKALPEYAHLEPFRAPSWDEARQAVQECLSIPVHPGVDDEARSSIIEALQGFRG